MISPRLGTLQQGEDEAQEPRPEVRAEDLVEAKDTLGTKGPMKSKTFEVMEECGELKSRLVNTVLWVGVRRFVSRGSLHFMR